jgi:two-component system nitrate/nitrite sensor histidine kinase NarX
MDTRAGLANLRHLKWIGIVAPVVFLLALEAVRLAVLDPAFGDEAANLLAAALATVAAVGFGLVLFFHIELAQREIVQQNRDLGLVNAVSMAIQGELDVEQVMQAALEAIVESTGVVRASIHVPAREPLGDLDRRIVHQPRSVPSDALSVPERTIEIPLDTGSTSLGHLRITVTAPHMDRLPSPAALQTAGHQLAAAVQIGQLVGGLQRRQDQGQTLYQILLQISNQAPLSDIIATIVNGARERLAADDGRMCLAETICNDADGQREVAAAVEAGVACQCDHPAEIGEEPAHPCPSGPSPEQQVTMHASIWAPGERFGELWVGRRSERAYGQRDRGYLMTLAGLAAIAISSARLRGNERQGAILAERDRIARELHDSLAQVLASIHLRLRSLLPRADLAERPRAIAELSDLADVAEEAYRDVREAILGLREASRPRGLLESLAAYLDKYSHQSGVRTALETSVDGELALPADSELQVIRVIQEALTNVRKHARATTARVRIALQPGGTLAIVVEDDGCGFDPTRTVVSPDGGFGVQTMRERVELVGGSLRIDSAPGRGSRVIAMVPLSAAASGRTGSGAAGWRAGA